MITVLLQKIIDLLSEHFPSVIILLSKLNLIEEDTEEMRGNVASMKTTLEDVDTQATAAAGKLATIDTTLTATAGNVAAIKSNSDVIKNNIITMSTNVGNVAAYTQNTANNTLDIDQKITSIASDTTQIRTNSNSIALNVGKIVEDMEYYFLNNIVTEEANGAICNFDTDLSDYLQICKVNLPADNTGFNGITISKCGKNLIDFDNVLPNGWSRTNSGITAEYSDGVMHVYGTNELNTWNNIVTFNDIWRNSELRLPSGVFSIPNHLVVRISEDNINYGNKGGTVTYSNSIYIRGFYVSVPANYTVDWYIPMVFVYGSTIPTTYEAYNIINYPVSFSSTITEGAEIDLLEGIAKVNTSPVTYLSFQPIAIKTYKGVNNIYANVGETTLTYRETLKHYLDKNN